MTEGAAQPQRGYRAFCPGCGAPVEFRSAASTHAVCAFCRSTLMRDGETISRIGRMAELFDDHSPLQVMARGVHAGRAFTVVGRLQYRSPSGVWSEWRVLFDDDASEAWLSEDNGNYVLSRQASLERDIPAAVHLRVGKTTAVDGRSFVVASNDDAVALIAAQGELPRLPAEGVTFTVVELRSERGEVLSLDYASRPPAVYLGREVTLDGLKMTGLREGSQKTIGARQFSCPHCGSAVPVNLATSRSVTCESCHSVIDLTASEAGASLNYARQADPVQPVIALGSVGRLNGRGWQVVGFQHRIGHEPGDEDEAFGWDEYLLYNEKDGFRFLVDSTEGWSLVQTLSAAPEWREGDVQVMHDGQTWGLDASYEAQTTWVAGEFYWPVERGQKSWNHDFTRGRSVLSRERSGTEITWSRGERISSDTVAAAFRITDRREELKRADVAPLSNSSGTSIGTVVFWIVLIIVVVLLQTRCSSCDPEVEDCSRSRVSSSGGSGGSWGGYSSGGGHK